LRQIRDDALENFGFEHEMLLHKPRSTQANLVEASPYKGSCYDRSATGAETIVLFGSRARGDNDDDSDWDLCVILPDNVEWGRFTPVTLWPLVSDLGILIQIVPIRRSVFEEKKTGINTLSHDIARDGVVIHGRLDRVAAP